MTSLRDIRNHLRSIQNIKKITDAMERVAAARLKRAQAKAEQSRPYFKMMKEILKKLSANDIQNPLFVRRDVKKSALIVISADKGLSGSYNTNILKTADRFAKKYGKESLDLLLFGRKAIDHFRNKEWPTVYKRTEWATKITLHEVQLFTHDVIDRFLSGMYDEVWLIYTHYISVMNREVILEKFLNIERPENKHEEVLLSYIFEPDPATIIDEILPRYCITRIQTALNEAYASELAARIVAMQTASNNSEKLIEELTLTRNKIRQEGITKEIIEITSAEKV